MSDINWKQYFNNKADKFGASVMTSGYFSEKSFYMQRQNTLKWLGDIKKYNVLDAGCGVGAFSETLVKENMVYGADFSEKSLEFAKKRGLNTYCGDIGNLPYEDGKFDLVMCIGVIQHIKEYERIIKELCRVTKSGGTVLVETLNANSLQRKILSIIDKTKRFDFMYDATHLEVVFKKYGLDNIEFMNIYYPLNHASYKKSYGMMAKYFSTSFAIKGTKRG